MVDDALPWETYTSDSVYSGWVHPVRRSDIADALSAAGATPRIVQRRLPRQSWGATPLIAARFGSNAYPHYFSSAVILNNAHLTVFAVPIEQLEIARNHLSHWLPRACRWLSEGTERGNAWLASDHNYSVDLDGLSIHVEQN